VEFEWDPLKATGNVEKHAVDFDTATEIFDDPNLFVVIDSRTIASAGIKRSALLAA
jgi:uncharacterized DUF497 family protein